MERMLEYFLETTDPEDLFLAAAYLVGAFAGGALKYLLEKHGISTGNHWDRFPSLDDDAGAPDPVHPWRGS